MNAERSKLLGRLVGSEQLCTNRQTVGSVETNQD